MSFALPDGRRGQALAAAVAFLLLAIAWEAVVIPVLDWYQSREMALNDQITLLRDMRLAAGSLPMLTAESRQAGRTRAVDELVHGSTDAIAGALLEQRLQDLADAAGATLSSAEVMNAPAEGAVHRIQIRITVDGAWSSLIAFLTSITAGQPTLLVDGLELNGPQISVPADQSSVPSMDATFTVIGFRDASSYLGLAGPASSSSAQP